MRLHTAKVVKFIERHDLFILTTHDPADADGLGAQLVLACILREKNKKFRIINASAIPQSFRYMDPYKIVEQWDPKKHGRLLKQAGLFILDTADDQTIGQMKEITSKVKEVFVIDHHEPKQNAVYNGLTDPSAASACELTIVLAEALGVTLDMQTAFAAYIGIAYDTGFFAYPKTGPRTLRSALMLLKMGVNPTDVYEKLHGSASLGALILQKKAMSSMTLHCKNRVAVQILRHKDFTEAGALQDETNGFVSFPLKAKNIVVSLLIKESPDGKLRCSLRSKGTLNVAKISQELNGGGHVNASGFKSDLNIEQTLAIALKKIAGHLDTT